MSPSSFPSTYSQRATAELLTVYATGPLRIAQALEGLSDAELRARPITGKMSSLELALHVVDSELIGATRIRLVHAQPGAHLMKYDSEQWARELNHNQADAAALASNMGLLGRLRETALRLFENATAADWAKTGLHPAYGLITLRNLLELYADHAERHVGQIVERRRLLGNPKDMPTLLAPRLY